MILIKNIKLRKLKLLKINLNKVKPAFLLVNIKKKIEVSVDIKKRRKGFIPLKISIININIYPKLRARGIIR